MMDAVECSLENAKASSAFLARLDESVAQAERGEGVTGEELRARHEARKAAFEKAQSA